VPIQSIYADFYVVDELWPDFSIEQFNEALAWYQEQDVTLGG
jgi:undecaprenyl diphosphate synthase